MPRRLLLASSLVSVALLLGLGTAYLATGSQLALAQAADSLADALTGLGLLWALRVSLAPPDENHPYGHHGAQPIAALVVAMLVGALALEVLLDSVEALRSGRAALMGWSVATGIGTKVAIKAVFVRLASVPALLRANAALRAFRVDARSDVIVGLTSLAGFLGARYGDWPMLDAWLALPVAAWIGISGAMLAKESIDLLMGTAPPREWQDELVRELLEHPQVRAVAEIKARSFGDRTQVWVEIRVDPQLSVGEAHDIGEAVEAALRQREDIVDAVVHVDAAVGLDPPPS
ncbi:MAG: cation transporter [Myxococcales bacterium]|nr:cation transporter [Myxococcales bacterium]MCB9715209.1 cation transporter [Myxococcales bacterium]